MTEKKKHPQTLKYYESNVFPCRYERVVKDPLNQIHLNFSYNPGSLDFSRIAGVKNIKVDCSTAVVFGLASFQAHVTPFSLYLHTSSLETISYFQNLQRLEIYHGSATINSLEPLKNIPVIILNQCAIKDASPLSAEKQRYVDLSGSKSLRNVTSLYAIHTVKLVACSSLKDVSGLGKNFSLDRAGCTSITDISSLAEVIHLNITGLSLVKDVSMLRSVRTLSVSGCKSLQSLAGLNKLRIIDIDKDMLPKLLPERRATLPHLRKINTVRPHWKGFGGVRRCFSGEAPVYEGPAKSYDIVRRPHFKAGTDSDEEASSNDEE